MKFRKSFIYVAIGVGLIVVSQGTSFAGRELTWTCTRHVDRAVSAYEDTCGINRSQVLLCDTAVRAGKRRCVACTVRHGLTRAQGREFCGVRADFMCKAALSSKCREQLISHPEWPFGPGPDVLAPATSRQPDAGSSPPASGD